jgi:hypothetical protein
VGKAKGSLGAASGKHRPPGATSLDRGADSSVRVLPERNDDQGNHFRRGQGLSADPGPFMQDVLQRQESLKGKQARQHLQDTELVAHHLDDVLATLSFLKTIPGVDSQRIVVAGHSSEIDLTGTGVAGACVPKGVQCRSGAVCCAGLSCVAGGTRHFCE